MRRGRLSDGAFRVELRPPADELRLAGLLFLAGFGAAALRAVVFRAAALVAPLRAADFLPPAAFRVDLPAFRAPPRAVLRTDDLDRLLDDALRLAMSV